jgi:DNA/RNA-binding domain of Phe-tRNA-synthetase-like protein
VDAYNLASASSGIPIAAFDADMLRGNLTLRFAKQNELFHGIGMNKPVTLEKNQVIMTDEKEIIAIYPYRDSDATKVTPTTKNIRIVACGVPKIDRNRVFEAYQRCARYLEEYAHGISSKLAIYPR